jgi:putative membrane protein
MVTDHGTLDQKLKPFDDKYSVTPPVALDAEDQAKYDKLAALSGKDFDKAYVAGMDKDHHAALTMFVDEQSTGSDKELRAVVTPATQTVQMHTKMANKLAYKYGLTVPDDVPNP